MTHHRYATSVTFTQAGADVDRAPWKEHRPCPTCDTLVRTRITDDVLQGTETVHGTCRLPGVAVTVSLASPARMPDVARHIAEHRLMHDTRSGPLVAGSELGLDRCSPIQPGAAGELRAGD